MLALIAPAVLVLVFFQILPIITGTNASFRDWHLHDPKKTWIGLTNYAYVMRDGDFLRTVLPNTFGFMFASVGCSVIAGLLILIMPRLLNLVVAIFLILNGLIGLGLLKWLHM